MPARPSTPFPIGVSLSAEGANVSVVSASADAAWLCLVDEAGREERIALPERDHGVWHTFLPGVGAGQRYGFRMQGAYDPPRGLRFDSDKLLTDPAARALTGEVTYGPEIYAHRSDGTGPSGLNSLGHVPLSVMVDESFDWGTDAPLRRRLADSIIYEAHVKGFTALHPDVPPELRGTYAGLAHPAATAHLVDLGVTAVELLPVHHSVTEPSVHRHGFVNYWGYNTLGYFAPHESYSATARAGVLGGQVAEFKAMVKALHAAGLEVILDVVYNHTCEGGPDGPTLCFRGLDNVHYYRLVDGDPARYYDTTGCGNSLDAESPLVLRLIMDSLRYWVEQMHVDGFRFDLASTLGREAGMFRRSAAFMDIITQDPVLSSVKLIAEPWDVGEADSYALGRFPALWSEWNGAYRDTVRDFWRGSDGLLSTYATRVAGSSDLFGSVLRRPMASVNFITAHDGFTLHDLVSYDSKHNEDNLEDNRDGTDGNLSWNHGAEGETDDAAILKARAQAQRTLLTVLLTSFGVPMILGGDELGRTQHGNNNAYCQDNEIAWYDWDSVDEELVAFTRRLIRLRREHPVLRRRRWLSGADSSAITWFTPAGAVMGDAQWTDTEARALGIRLEGQDSPDLDANGQPLLDDDLVILVNAWWEPLEFQAPEQAQHQPWLVVVDSADPAKGEGAQQRNPIPVWTDGASVTVSGRSVLVLRSPR